MFVSMATANFYQMPFKQALHIIKGAGFDTIELDGYWRGGDNWEAGQHIKDIPPRDVIQMVADSGLSIASFHDMGGVIEDGSNSTVSLGTYEYLEYFDFPCVVFHTPHRKTTDKDWWDTYKPQAKADLQAIGRNRIICLENMVHFNGYAVPLLNPDDMLEFAEDAGVFINIDTTHYAQCHMDISSAAGVLNSRVKTIHLSDYHAGISHMYVGDGDLDFKGFYDALDIANLYATTIECNMPSRTDDDGQLIERCRNAKRIVEGLTASF